MLTADQVIAIATYYGYPLSQMNEQNTSGIYRVPLEAINPEAAANAAMTGNPTVVDVDEATFWNVMDPQGIRYSTAAATQARKDAETQAQIIGINRQMTQLGITDLPLLTLDNFQQYSGRAQDEIENIITGYDPHLNKYLPGRDPGSDMARGFVIQTAAEIAGGVIGAAIGGASSIAVNTATAGSEIVSTAVAPAIVAATEIPEIVVTAAAPALVAAGAAGIGAGLVAAAGNVANSAMDEVVVTASPTPPPIITGTAAGAITAPLAASIIQPPVSTTPSAMEEVTVTATPTPPAPLASAIPALESALPTPGAVATATPPAISALDNSVPQTNMEEVTVTGTPIASTPIAPAIISAGVDVGTAAAIASSYNSSPQLPSDYSPSDSGTDSNAAPGSDAWWQDLITKYGLPWVLKNLPWILSQLNGHDPTPADLAATTAQLNAMNSSSSWWWLLLAGLATAVVLRKKRKRSTDVKQRRAPRAARRALFSHSVKRKRHSEVT